MTTVLYRKYRPDTFADVIGQEHVTDALQAALNAGRVAHAYLFSGPRGCGKTTSARIMARCLNCAQGPTANPCGECPSCVELAAGGSGSLDVIEIDAASHNGVEDAREMRERAAFAPSRDRYRIFILDEAHMVTVNGFNALLKLVEEPPEHVKFIFATTEPEKVLETIRSRTHHYPFRLVPPEILVPYLNDICQRENVQVEDGVLPLVVRAGAGSVRDSLSVLDQLLSGREDTQITYQSAVALLGYTDTTLLDRTIQALGANDGAAAFTVIEEVVASGHDPRRFTEDLLQRLRDMMIIQIAGNRAESVLPNLPVDQIRSLREQAAQWGTRLLSRRADLIEQALREMTGTSAPRLQLELLVARLLIELPKQRSDARETLPPASATIAATSAQSGVRGGDNFESLQAAPKVLETPMTQTSTANLNNAPSQTAPGESDTAASQESPSIQRVSVVRETSPKWETPINPKVQPNHTNQAASIKTNFEQPASRPNQVSAPPAEDLSAFTEIFEKGLKQLPRSLYGRVRNADAKIVQVSGQTIVFTARPVLQAKAADFTHAMQQIFGANWSIQLVDVTQWQPQPLDNNKQNKNSEQSDSQQYSQQYSQQSNDKPEHRPTEVDQQRPNQLDNSAADIPSVDNDAVGNDAVNGNSISDDAVASGFAVDSADNANNATISDKVVSPPDGAISTANSDATASSSSAVSVDNSTGSSTKADGSTKTDDESPNKRDVQEVSDQSTASPVSSNLGVPSGSTNPVDTVLQTFQGKIIQED